MRLFAAVRPPVRVLDHLETALLSARAGTPVDDARGPLRWTTPDDRHLTIAFYGQVSAGLEPELIDALREVAGRTAPFELRLRGAGVFDRRTVWVGCAGDGITPLMASAGRVGSDLLGRVDDRVGSRAHLTVARVRPTDRARGDRGAAAAGRRGADTAVADLVRALAVSEGPAWLVDEIVLVGSELGAGPGGGARHEPVERFGLSAVAG